MDSKTDNEEGNDRGFRSSSLLSSSVKNNSEAESNLKRIKCSIQYYDWGVVPSEKPSSVAELGSMNRRERVEIERPHAELWMGTHLSGLNVIITSNDDDKNNNNNNNNNNNAAMDDNDDDNNRDDKLLVSLKQYVLENQEETIGSKCKQRFGEDLPFLLKVLSVAKALSIQAHPDKALAELLHKEKPDMYKDANHKPEMALAVTVFEAMSGFVDEPELALEKCPELRALTGIEAASSNFMNNAELTKEERMRQLFTKVMLAEKQEVTKCIKTLIERLNVLKDKNELTDEQDILAMRLNEQYPDDVGVMCAYLLNYIKLQPGEAVYMAANEPHAYLDGECVEIMATSDNVVRAGLTPKARDTEVLCKMLTYKLGKPEILRGDEIDKNTKRYSPPFDEFELEVVTLEGGSSSSSSSCEMTVSEGPSIVLVTKGKGKINNLEISKGSVIFANANERMILTTFADSDEGLFVYRAQVNTRVFA